MKIDIERAERWYISLSKELYLAIMHKCNGPLDWRKIALGTYAELYQLIDSLAPLDLSDGALQEYNNLLLALGSLDDSENLYITIGRDIYR